MVAADSGAGREDDFAGGTDTRQLHALRGTRSSEGCVPPREAWVKVMNGARTCPREELGVGRDGLRLAAEAVAAGGRQSFFSFGPA